MNGVVFMRRKLRSSSHHISAFLFSPIRYRITTQGSRKALWYVSILTFPSFVEYADLYDQIPTPRHCSPPLLCPHLLCYFYCLFLVHSHYHHHNRKVEMTLPCCICRYRVSAFLFEESSPVSQQRSRWQASRQAHQRVHGQVYQQGRH